MEKRKGERGGRGSSDQALSSRESGWFITLVVVKGPLWRISHRDRVSSPEGCAGRTDGPSVCLKTKDASFLLVS